MKIDSLDHLVLTVKNIEASCQFYQSALGMAVVRFGAGRTALAFGLQKINLHQAGKEFEPKADRPTPGSADLCFLTSVPLPEVQNHPYEKFEEIINLLMDDVKKESINTDPKSLFTQFPTMTEKEFAFMCGISREEANLRLMNLFKEGSINKFESKNGVIWMNNFES